MNIFKRLYTVMEMRTGLVAGSCALVGSAYGAYINGQINILLTILICISAFSFNIVANVANEIRGFLNQEEDINNLANHFGTDGLIRGDAKLKDAILALIFSSLVGILSGLLIIFITNDFRILIIGTIGFVAAITYSLTPMAYIKFPVGEFVSGLMCGFLCTLSGIMLQVGEVDIYAILFSVISYFMVSFLMAANNTLDIKKDEGKRITFAHVVGFRRSITILIPQIVAIYIIWIIVALFGLENFLILIFGLGILTHFGIFKWYIPYYSLKEFEYGLSPKYGPLPLVLLLGFNFFMTFIFLIGMMI